MEADEGGGCALDFLAQHARAKWPVLLQWWQICSYAVQRTWPPTCDHILDMQLVAGW